MLEFLLKILAPLLVFLGFGTTTTLPLPVATTTPVVVATSSVIAKSTPKPLPPKIRKTQKPAPKVLPIVVIPPPVTTPEKIPEPTPLLNLTTQNEAQRNATVNILCTTKSSGAFAPISGSGVVIDPRGVILTNAHVAQYYLLRDFRTPGFIDCIIRTGSPAQPAYRAELIYVSENWIQENASKINTSASTGTGRYDFGLLRITETIEGGTLPSNFSFVEIDTDFTIVPTNLEVLLASYPAEFAGGIATQRDLQLVSSPAIIKRAFYFDSPGNVDLFSVGGNITAQGGSSGGGVSSRETGKLLGIIVTSTDAKTTDEKDLHAVTTTHISSTLHTESGMSLTDFLAGDPKVRGDAWRDTKFTSLRKQLEDVLLGN